MTLYIVKRRSFLFPNAEKAKLPAAPAGTPMLEVGERFEGTFSPDSNKLIDKTTEPKGVVAQANLLEVPAELPPITTDVGRILFCWAATSAAQAEKADRNYLVSVAYYLSTKLGDFGKPADLRYGPFRYNAEEWFAAAKANAASHGVEPEGLFDPAWQATVAAIRTGKAMKEFVVKHNRSPIPVELFFYERLGEEGLSLLKLAPATLCSAAVGNAPPAGSYGAEIKDRKSDDVIKEVADGLKAGFAASRADVAQLEPHMRFFSDEDFAPWLTVARVMTSDNLAVQATTLAGTFMTFPPALGPADRRSAAFVAFCLIECGVAEAKQSVPGDNKAGLPVTWEDWSNEAVAPLRPGAIVVTKPEEGKASVGILAETPKDDTCKVYFCSDDGPISVGVKPIARDKIAKLRWLDITGAGGVVDPIALANAPAKIQGTMAMAQKAFTRLRAATWSPAQACGILANIQLESSFDFKNTTGDGGDAHGLCQWHEDRRKIFEQNFHKTFGQSTFDDQVDFITFEMNNNEIKAGNALREATTPSKAADIVVRKYERSGDQDGDSAKRMPLADAYALVFK